MKERCQFNNGQILVKGNDERQKTKITGQQRESDAVANKTNFLQRIMQSVHKGCMQSWCSVLTGSDDTWMMHFSDVLIASNLFEMWLISWLSADLRIWDIAVSIYIQWRVFMRVDASGHWGCKVDQMTFEWCPANHWTTSAHFQLSIYVEYRLWKYKRDMDRGSGRFEGISTWWWYGRLIC